jgi:hypothetical protein
VDPHAAAPVAAVKQVVASKREANPFNLEFFCMIIPPPWDTSKVVSAKDNFLYHMRKNTNWPEEN